MIFVGDDWAEAHHDVCVLDEAGAVLAKRRVLEGVTGVAQFHELVAGHVENPSDVVIGIETERGPFVAALVAAGYQVFAVNPLAASRYRERHVTSGAKSDAGDAKVLADLVRTDRHNHRRVAGDSDLAEAIKVLARAHQNLIWSQQAHGNVLRSTLREFYPAALVAVGDDLGGRDALAVLATAPTPEAGRGLSRSQLAAVLRRGGRQRYLEARAGEIRQALQSEQLSLPPRLSAAFGASVAATVAVIGATNAQITALQEQLTSHFDEHPDAEILRSLPGLGPVLAPRVLAEFGDDPNRYADAKSRKNYAGTSPITKASGTRRAVLARAVRNRRLSDACYQWAFCAIEASPGARQLYDRHRAGNNGRGHHQALRAVANRLVGILHGCLASHQPYDEAKAWPSASSQGQAA